MLYENNWNLRYYLLDFLYLYGLIYISKHNKNTSAESLIHYLVFVLTLKVNRYIDILIESWWILKEAGEINKIYCYFNKNKIKI